MTIEQRISWLRRVGLSLAIVTVSISLMPLVASADVGDVVNTAADTTGNVASTVGERVGAPSGSVNGGALGDHSNGASRSGPSTTAPDRSSDKIGHPTSATSGSHPRGQVRRDAYEGAHLSVVGYQGGSGGQEPTTDPCTLDQRLVCLGLLFGLGEFADTGAEVLGDVLANTGVGVIGLTVLTAMLLIAGSAALAASSRRLRVVTRTG